MSEVPGSTSSSASVFRFAAGLVLAAGMTFGGAPRLEAQAELFPTFSVRAGGFAVSNGTDVRLDAAAGDGIGTEIDFEKELGLDSDLNLLTVGLEWLPLERHQFRVAYFRTGRSGSESLLDREIEWGDQVYPVGAEISGEFTSTYIELDWTWWLFKGDRGGFGPTLGVMYLDLSAGLAAHFHIGSLDLRFSREASATAPIPSIGVEGRGAILRSLFVLGYVRFLPDVTIGNISGDALQFNAALEWMPLEHAGLGVAYHGFGIDAEIDDSSYNGALNLDTDGFQLYGRFSW